MTAQINDVVNWNDVTWFLVGINGKGLFEPSDHELHPVMISTACWRGFICNYEVSSDRLVLEKLVIGLDGPDRDQAEAGTGPFLRGSAPIFSKVDGAWTYEAIHLDIDFTGALLLTRGFIQELYVHMGFHPAWKWENVAELKFSSGLLLEATDMSARFAEIRASMSPEDIRPTFQSGDESLKAWIEGTFDRSYRQGADDASEVD